MRVPRGDMRVPQAHRASSPASRPMVTCGRPLTAQIRNAYAYSRLSRHCQTRRSAMCLPALPEKRSYMKGSKTRVAVLESEPSPFFEPLIRCFLLGVASGGLFESYSVLSKMADLSTHTANVWRLMTAYSPQFVQDHVLAIGLWLLFYMVECTGSSSGAQNSSNQTPLKFRMSSFPKILMPLNLTGLTGLWLSRPQFPISEGLKAATAVLDAPVCAPPMHGSPGVKPVQPSGKAQQRTVPETPFVPDRVARPGLTAGQWNNDFVQREIARKGYMEGMFYCIGAEPPGGLAVGTVYSASAMGTRIAYWQDEAGKVHAISSVCTHRGAQLSNGWVDNVEGKSCVVCPYHAWAFSGDGVVQRIPVQPDGRFPKRPLQQSFDVTVKGGKIWLYWGRPSVPADARPPIPGAHFPKKSFKSALVTKICDVPHHTVFDQLASEGFLAAIARVFMGISNCTITSEMDVDDQQAYARSQTYTVRPISQIGSPLLPQGSSISSMQIRLMAQLPSSVIAICDLGQGRAFGIEAHVHPETYDTSRLTMSVHRNFAHWPGSGMIVRDQLITLAEGIRGNAEGTQFSHSVLPSFKPQNMQDLLQSMNYLKAEFSQLGYTVPAEIAQSIHRSDM